MPHDKLLNLLLYARVTSAPLEPHLSSICCLCSVVIIAQISLQSTDTELRLSSDVKNIQACLLNFILIMHQATLVLYSLAKSNMPIEKQMFLSNYSGCNLCFLVNHFLSFVLFLFSICLWKKITIYVLCRRHKLILIYFKNQKKKGSCNRRRRILSDDCEFRCLKVLKNLAESSRFISWRGGCLHPPVACCGSICLYKTQ